MSPSNINRNELNESQLNCDYLVVGAGTAGMAFVDEMLTQDASATIVLVDKNSAPGGHWTKAYPFVRLHQPSCFYGVNSVKLGKHRDSKGNELYDVDDRATGAEVLEYFQRVLEKFEASGRVRSFFSSEYAFDETRQVHTIVRNTGGDDTSVLAVNCRKVVTVSSDVTVPSMREPLVPVHRSVSFVPVNDIPQSVDSGNYNKYVVLGNGKTGVDAVANLLDRGIDQSQITWIVSRDIWFMVLDSFADLYDSMPTFANKMLTADSVKDCFLSFEKDGLFCRLDPNGPFPEVFKGAAIATKELEQIRSIRNLVKMGRVTSIEAGQIVLDRGSLDFSPQDTLLVDCMVDNTYGYASYGDDFTIFEPERINLGPSLGSFNICLTSAVVAFLECSLKDDVSRNGCCYFMRGRYMTKPETMIGSMYMDAKYSDALMKIKGGAKFLFSSRLNMNAPMHHRRGMLRLAWNLFGPHQMHKFGTKLAQKVESKGYSDVDHLFGIETMAAVETATSEPPKQAKNPRKFFPSRRRYRHTAPMP